MTIEDFNALVDQAYDASFSYEQKLIGVYLSAYTRQGDLAVTRFKDQTEPITAAAWTPPAYESLVDGMNEKEIKDADRVRDEAAAAILAVFASIGLASFGVEFMQAISERAQLNFEQELLRNLRKIVADGFADGLSSEETAVLIRDKFAHVTPASAEMLAQTELTTLVNQKSLEAAQKQFPNGILKTWLSMNDAKVRVAHAQVSGKSVPQDQPFQVGGSSMMYPGDPSAPLRLTARCRCRLSFAPTTDPVTASAQEDTIVPMTDELNPEIKPVPVNMFLISNPSTEGTTATFSSTIVNTHGTNELATITISTDDAADGMPDVSEAEVTEMADGAPWRCLLAVEGVQTEDGRYLDVGSTTWRELPLSLMALDYTGPGGHEGAVVAGRIDNIWRNGNEIWGDGVFNGNEVGAHFQELVSNQSLRGNSVDLAITGYEYRDDMGNALSEEQLMDAMMSDTPVVFAVTAGVIMASTIVPTPAIKEANIVLASGRMVMAWFEEQPTVADAITASAAGLAPVHPPAAWFENPGLRELTPLTVTDDGRVMGHAAGWNVCHVGEPGGPGVCVTPPRSGMNYEIFHHGAVTTAEGHDVSVGHITMSTYHAASSLGWKAAQDHYDNSGAVVADVRAGEDQYGIWVSGALRPDLSVEKVREMKAGSISGDWRSVIGRGLEFISALIVNIPGFPIPRASASITASASGGDEIESLVAAGIVECDCVDDMSRREYLRKIRALTN